MKKNILALAVMSAVAMQASAGTVTSDGSDIVIKTKGGFAVETVDGDKSFNIGGRIQWDWNSASIDPASPSSDERNEENQFDVRRARVFLKGHVGDWAYKAQWNLDDEGSSGGDIEDLYIRYTGWGKKANVTIGRAKAPFGLEELTSSKDISILERSAITELFAAGRQDGIQLHGKGSNWTYGIGAYEAGDDDNNSGNTSGSDTTARNVAVVGRFTFAPINEKGNVLHLGAAFQQASGAERDNGGSVENFGLEDAYGVEIAGVAGPFHYQAEYFDGTLAFGDMIDGSDDVDGYYVQAGWILTGESRPYKDGKFKIVKPSKDSGAWEIVARYEDGDGNFGDIELGSLDNAKAYTFGVNYYANSNIRIGANYTMGESDLSDDEGEEIRVRFQYVYK